MGKSIYLSGHSSGMTKQARDMVERCGILFKSPLETPKGEGVKSINVTARKVWNTFANKRVFESLTGIDTVYSRAQIPIGITLFRENIEDTYGSIEHYQTNDVAQCRRLITRPGSLQLHNLAFETALKRNARRLTCVHKANIMKLTDGLFLDCFYEVAKKYPTVTADDIIVDDLCMKLVSAPSKFDFLVAPNLQGDIISDLCAGLVGGLGVCPSANIGTNISIFEAVHGTAPDIAGKNTANPTGLLLSGLMMLRHLGLKFHAEAIHLALMKTLQQGFRTVDLLNHINPAIPLPQQIECVGTTEFAAAIIQNLPAAALKEFTSTVEWAVHPPVKPLKPIILVTEERDQSKERVIGTDLFVDSSLGPAELAAVLARQAGKFSSPGFPNLDLTMLSNRGTQVYPSGSLFTECVNHYRARFEALPTEETSQNDAGGSLKESDLLLFASHISKVIRVCSVEMLLEINGKKKYSLAQGQ